MRERIDAMVAMMGKIGVDNPCWIRLYKIYNDFIDTIPAEFFENSLYEAMLATSQISDVDWSN